jgi:hypothetical protein
LMVGLVLFALVGKDLAEHPKNFTDLFVYNYDRPYPNELVERPISFLAGKTFWLGDVLALLLFGVGVYQVCELFVRKREKRKSNTEMTGLVFLAMGAALLLTLTFASPSAIAPWLGSLMQPVNVKTAMGFAFALGGLWCAVALILRSRARLFGGFGVLALSFALWFNWSHWVSLSHNWTQRDQFWRYYGQRSPDEPIAAYLMNWRGETFYSKNTVKQIKENGMLARYAALPGRKWSLVEHNRLPLLRSGVGPGKTVTPVDPGLNNKFVLVKIE